MTLVIRVTDQFEMFQVRVVDDGTPLLSDEHEEGKYEVAMEKCFFQSGGGSLGRPGDGGGVSNGEDD